jgi:hypothetical protein
VLHNNAGGSTAQDLPRRGIESSQTRQWRKEIRTAGPTSTEEAFQNMQFDAQLNQGRHRRQADRGARRQDPAAHVSLTLTSPRLASARAKNVAGSCFCPGQPIEAAP